eukprot:scaffold4383_cov61-Cyclotella_meneghiniana.AAC.12
MRRLSKSSPARQAAAIADGSAPRVTGEVCRTDLTSFSDSSFSLPSASSIVGTATFFELLVETDKLGGQKSGSPLLSPACLGIPTALRTELLITRAPACSRVERTTLCNLETLMELFAARASAAGVLGVISVN